MVKNYVLDTNVLICDPEAIFKFDDNNIIIPIFVIEEIDKFKEEGTERGRNCRYFCRLLEDLRSKSKNMLSRGVSLGEDKGTLTIYVPMGQDKSIQVENGDQDRAILETAILIRDNSEPQKTILVTMDTNLRIRSDAAGMHVKTYENSRNEVVTSSSVIEITAEKGIIDEFWDSGQVSLKTPLELPHNASVLMRDIGSPAHTALGRYNRPSGSLLQLKTPKEGVMGIRPKNKEQAFALDLLLDNEIQLITLLGAAGTGKSQPLTEPVLTPSGFVPMGQIKIGDFVIGSHGRPVEVSGVYPQGELETYRVTLSDGSSTRCSLDHLWSTKTCEERSNGSDYKTRTTREIMETIKSVDLDQPMNHSIPMIRPVEFPEQDVGLHPYFMGLVLGNKFPRGEINFTTHDLEVIENFRELVPDVTSITHDIRNAIDKYGSYGSHDNDKFIPNEYKLNSVSNRINLLLGIMDSNRISDHRVVSGKEVSITIMSSRLRDDIIFIVRSLGGMARCRTRIKKRHVNGESVKCQKVYTVRISLPIGLIPFKGEAKEHDRVPNIGDESLTRYITGVRKVGRENCQCIRVDSSDSLYATNDFIVTHNTLLAIAAGLHKVLNDGFYKRVLVSRPIMPLGKDIGFLPGSVDEKMSPWMQPIFDNLEFLLNSKKSDPLSYDDLMSNGTIQVEPLTYIRGRSLPFQYIIVDECQNLNVHEIKTIITRVGEGSKIILTGDPQQIDNPHVDESSNGLSVVMDRFKGQTIFGNVVLTKGERSELAELATKIL